MDKKWFFSVTSGEVYELPVDEAHLLDNKQIPLKEKPPAKCNKCYGLFYTNYYITGGYYLICKKCGKKCIDYDFMTKNALSN